MRDDDDTTYVTALYATQTDRAVCVEYEGDQIWIPKSVIHNHEYDGAEDGDEIELEVSRWFYEREL